MGVAESHFCSKHPNRDLVSVCRVSDCATPLLCMECLESHDRGHSRETRSLREALEAQEFMQDLEQRRQSQLVVVAEALKLHQNFKEGLKAQITQTFDSIIWDLTLKKKQLIQEVELLFKLPVNESLEGQLDPNSTAEHLTKVVKDLETMDLREGFLDLRLKRMLFLHKNLLSFKKVAGKFQKGLQSLIEPMYGVKELQDRWATAIDNITLEKLRRRVGQNPNEWT